MAASRWVEGVWEVVAVVEKVCIRGFERLASEG